MRQLWDNKGSAIIEGMKLLELAAYAQMCGRTLEMLRRADEDRPLVVRLDAELNRLTAREATGILGAGPITSAAGSKHSNLSSRNLSDVRPGSRVGRKRDGRGPQRNVR